MTIRQSDTGRCAYVGTWQLVLLGLLFGLALGLCVPASSSAAADRPNILWFVVDDMSAHFACYGETRIETPHVDRLAREGVRFTSAHVTAPVCSTCRSAFLTGMHQASLGSHNHRMTGPPIQLPDSVVPVPVLFQKAGYYTCNGDGLPKHSGKIRKKTDYNFVYDPSIYDSTDWRGRQPGQPFFMQVQLAGGKLRGASEDSFKKIRQRARQQFGDNVALDDVELPPYYPDDPVLLRDWAAYLESVRLTDHHVGQVLARLEREGILDKTLIIFMTDHGISHARGKQFNYNEGTHIPFVVRGPGVSGGQVRDDFIEHIDMAAISLAAAGIAIGQSMQARDVLADGYQPRTAAFAARDRCDETIDFIRSARADGLLYIRNYNPFRPHLQPSRYKDNKVLLKRLRELRNAGSLSPLQMKLLFSHSRPPEELYDTKADPHETHNLVKDPKYTESLHKMRRMLDQHLINTRDAGFVPEPLIAEISGAAKQTVYDFCQSDEHYPVAQIVRLANLAITENPETIVRLRRELQSSNSIRRYWATVGLRVLGQAALPARPDLAEALEDPDASVRIGAAMALSTFGDKRRIASLLIKEAEKATNDAHALWALDGIKYLDLPEVVQGTAPQQLVKGQFSGRAVDYLTKGGLVFGTGTDYWNP